MTSQHEEVLNFFKSKMTQPDAYFGGKKKISSCFLENRLTGVRGSMETPERWSLKATGKGCCSDHGGVE